MDQIVQEVQSRYSTFTAIPWTTLAKGFLTCLDTENIYDPLHPYANKEGHRTVYKGHRETHERVSCITNTHEFTLALAEMLEKDKELREKLLRSPHEDLAILAGFYAELNDYTSTAKENSASFWSHTQPCRRVTNAWLTWALVYLCGHVMQFELSTIAKRVTSGSVMEIVMGRALAAQQYDIYDYLQRNHMQWFWLLNRCHTINDKGPRLGDLRAP